MTPSATQIEGARKLARLTRGGFAALVGVDPSTIYRWERDLSAPKGAPLQSLQKALALIGKNSETDACITATIAENR